MERSPTLGTSQKEPDHRKHTNGLEHRRNLGMVRCVLRKCNDATISEKLIVNEITDKTLSVNSAEIWVINRNDSVNKLPVSFMKSF